MKKSFSLAVLPLLVFLFSCGNSPGGPAETPGKTPSSAAQAGSNLLSGEWKKTSMSKDENGNGLLDEAERKPLDIHIGSGYFRFDPNGTCLYEVLKFEGTYEVKSEGGKNRIVIYPLAGGQPIMDAALKYPIVSLSSKEMVLSFNGYFGIYHRP